MLAVLLCTILRSDRKLYLLHNGTDSPQCGSSPVEACTSFQKLLDVFYANYTAPLDVITDMSITIDRQIQVRSLLGILISGYITSILNQFSSFLSNSLSLQDRHPNLSRLNINLYGFIDAPENISFILRGVSFISTSHQVVDLNMDIMNCTLIDYQLQYKQGFKDSNGYLKVSNLDTLVYKKGRLSLKNSQLIGGNSIKIKNAFVNMDRIKIRSANQKGPVIDVIYSYLALTNSIVVGNSVTRKYYAVLSISHSQASLSNCTFKRNIAYEGGAIYASHNTSLIVVRSVFESNNANYLGGAIAASTFVNVSLLECVFRSNGAYHSGGAIASRCTTRFKIFNTTFAANNAKVGNGGSIFAQDWNYYSIDSCSFINNFCEFKSGVLQMQFNGTAVLNDCTFTSNRAVFTRSVLAAETFVTLTISGCTFDNNTSEYVGVLDVAYGSNATVTNCTFTRNVARITSLLHVQQDSFLFITYSSFHDNIGGGSLISGDYDVQIHVTASQFLNRSMAANPFIVLTDSYLFLFESHFYNNTRQNDGGIVVARNSKINVKSCQFIKNNASKGGVFYLDNNSGLVVVSSYFFKNSAGDGAVAFLQDSIASFVHTNVSNSNGLGYGGIITAYNSKLTVDRCQFSSSKAVYGGCFYLQSNSSLAAHRSVFEYNYATEGGVIFKYGAGNVSLTNCSLRNNIGQSGASIFQYNTDYIRLAGGNCLQPRNACVIFYRDKAKAHKGVGLFYSDNFTISDDKNVLNSRRDGNFLHDAEHLKVVLAANTTTKWVETPYASRKLLLSIQTNMEIWFGHMISLRLKRRSYRFKSTFLKKKLVDICPFVRPLIPLFWTLVTSASVSKPR